MTEKIVFEKVYTRDTCIILQQAWDSALNKTFEEKFGVSNPNKPQVLYYFTNGVIELWVNKKSGEWITEELLKKNKRDPSFSLSVIKDYSIQLKDFEIYWQKGHASEAEEFQNYLDLLFRGMIGYVVMYYSSINESTPSEIKSVADEIRTADTFFDENDKFIRNSLKVIYPKLSEYVTAIVLKEIFDPPSLKDLEKRNRGAVLVSDNFELTSLSNYADSHKNFSFKDLEVQIGQSDIKGSVAFKGFASGVVRIVRKKSEVGFVKEGEIIISPMTTPDYVSAMKIASAFVTDEGGIMCHAAIIARELKKPCIIGTKIATKVLHDGDLVKVDANKGIIKIIKKSL